MPHNPDLLNGMQFDFVHADTNYSTWGDNYHSVLAIHPSEEHPIGRLDWTRKTGEVRVVRVDPNYQRQGVATQLWHRAKAVATDTRGVKPPKHSADRTDAGDAWARTVGGGVPRRG